MTNRELFELIEKYRVLKIRIRETVEEINGNVAEYKAKAERLISMNHQRQLELKTTAIQIKKEIGLDYETHS